MEGFCSAGKLACFHILVCRLDTTAYLSVALHLQVLQPLASYTARAVDACTQQGGAAAAAMQGALHVLSLLLEAW